MNVADTIKGLLDGRTHRVLIDATGIDESRMSRLLAGHTEIRVGEIRLIEEAFSLGPGELLALTEKQQSRQATGPLRLAARRGRKRSG